jgi:RNA methyltransferase, TrmH family
MRLKSYDRAGALSYTFGVFPTLELLHHQPGQTRQILLHSAGARNRGVQKIRALCEQQGLPLIEDDRQVERLEAKENTYAIGVFEKYQPRLNARANHLLLVNPSDMGNLGTIQRTLLGFGLRDLVLLKPAADVFDPRAIRASMGALFQINFAYFDSLAGYRQRFTHHLYPFMTDGVIPLPEVHFQPPFCLIFGSESSGLSADYQNIGTSISIPQSGHIDSLNLAVAVGIALYASGRSI